MDGKRKNLPQSHYSNDRFGLDGFTLTSFEHLVHDDDGYYAKLDDVVGYRHHHCFECKALPLRGEHE